MNNLNVAEEFKYRGQNIRIVYHEHCLNPRENCDYLSTMAYKSRDYLLGDEKVNDWNTWLCGMIDWDEDLMDDYAYKHNFNDSQLQSYLMDRFSEKYIWLPVFAYIHGGATVNTTGFSCRWDSGQCGIIYVSKEVIKTEYSWRRLSKKRTDMVYEILREDVKVFDSWLRGECYGWIVGDYDDSCWGYIGDSGLQQAIEEAKQSIDWNIQQRMRSHAERIKRWIKSRVPFIYRTQFNPIS